MMSYKRVIIDGDTLLFIEALKAQNSTFKFDMDFEFDYDIQAIEKSILDSIQDIMFNTGCTKYTMYLTGKSNFRYSILPSYKWRRSSTQKPVILEELKRIMVDRGRAILVNGLEADDLCVMDMTKVEEGVIKTLAHVDKDLNQASGRHYNFNTKEIYDVTQKEADYHILYQMLVGDNSDCYLGCPKVGDTKVPSIIESSYMIRPEIKEYSKGVKKGQQEIVWQTFFDPTKSLQEVILSWFIYGGATKGFMGHKKGFDTTSGFEEGIKITPTIKKKQIVISKKEVEFVMNEMNIQYTVARMLRDGDEVPKKTVKFI